MATLRQERARLRALPEEEHLDNSPETVAQRRNMFARMGWDTSDLPEIPVVDAMVSTFVIEPEEIIAHAEPDKCYCPDDCSCHHSWRETICGCTAHETPIVPADIPDAVAEPGVPYNAVTGANYTGKNVMRLIMAEAEHGFGAGGWAGFGQWRQIGRTVKRGEHGTGLIRMGAETVKHEDGTTSVGKVRPFGARVFHFDQTTELVPAEDGE